jgi:integrase
MKGEAGFYLSAYSAKRVQKTTRKWDNPPAQPPISCPECSSTRFWRDGVRKTREGPIQRYICRECGFRFSGSSLRDKNEEGYTTECRVCVSEGEMKNLTTAETQTENQAAGATKTNTNTKSLLFNFAWWMKKEGYAQTTITTREKLLKILAKRGADLQDPESVKEVIAQQEWCNKRKINAADAYTAFLRMHGQIWNPPRYRYAEKLPFIPTEEELDALIAGCGPKTSTFLQLLKETAMRAGEAHKLKWADIDFATCTVRITPEKGSNPRIFKLSNILLNRLIDLKAKTKSNQIFSKHLRTQRRLFQKQRTTLARKLKNPRLKEIHFHTFRHWKATMLCHQTNGNIYYVMKFLGHKNIRNTMTYIHLAEVIFNKEDHEFICEPATTVEEAKALIEAGFTFEHEINGISLFKKLK